jgi:secondary thiamine-phosphate synthase enzyme
VEYIIIKTNNKEELIDITEEVNNIIRESGVKEGLCNIFALHATAAIVINENWDDSVQVDLLTRLRKLIPDHDNYLHDKQDNNAASHLKSALLGPSETIPIVNGRLELGRWQSIVFCEFDGPKAERKIAVQILK